MEKLKQSEILFKKLIKDEKSVFYTADRINKTLLNKVRKSFYKKDKIFYKFYLELENKTFLYENDEGTKTRIPFYTLQFQIIVEVLIKRGGSNRQLKYQ